VCCEGQARSVAPSPRFGCAARTDVTPSLASEGEAWERFKRDLTAQLARCPGRKANKAWFTKAAYCDDAGDCPDKHACCLGEADLGLWYQMCVPARADGRTACEQHELCREDGPACVTRNTSCHKGRCMLTNPSSRCAKGTCRGDKPVCCVRSGKAECTARDACTVDEATKAERYECGGSGDCPGGNFCCAGASSSWCAGSCDMVHGGAMCQNATDCPQIPARGRPRCLREPDSALFWAGRCVYQR
jgi:hypothetical protein